MDFQKLSRILFVGGACAIAVAFIWWYDFYQQFGKDVFSAISCLYSSDGACGLAAGIAQFAGKTVYSPIIFWVGAIAVVISLLMKAMIKR